MTGRLVIVRQPSWTIWAGRFAVRVDGRKVGKVDRDGSRDFEIEAGTHRVRVTQLGASSRTLVMSVADGETVVLRAGVRYWINVLSNMFGTLIGGSGFWLLAHGPTPTRLAMFAVGVAGSGAVVASRAVIRLRPDPAGQPRFGHADISTDTDFR